MLAVGLPLLASLLIIASWRWPDLREAWTLVASVSTFGLIFSMLPGVLGGSCPSLTLFSIAEGVSLAFRADTAGLIFALSSSFLWIITSIFSIGYMRGLQQPKQTRYYACFALAIASTMGIALSANLLTFLIFFEGLTIATYPLIIHRENEEAVSAGRKYLAYLLTGGLSLILAIGITLQLTGVLDFKAGGFLSNDIDRAWLLALFALFTLGFGMKSAIIPLHSWLPSAMVAPTPVSALLHAVAVVKAGVFGFVRLIGYVFGPQIFQDIGAGAILAILASITIILSSLLALQQDNLKRRLAYSTIGHLSYIVLGVSLLSPVAWTGGLLHIVNHAMLKITLFFCAGAIYVHSHLDKVSEMDGIGRRMPLTMLAFTLGCIGLIGIPPLNGFISKWMLAQGAVSTSYALYMGVLLLSGLLNAAYFVPIIRRSFFVPAGENAVDGEAPLVMVIPLLTTAALGLVLGLWPNAIFHFWELAENTVNAVMGGALP